MKNSNIKYSYPVLGRDLDNPLGSLFYGCYSSAKKALKRVEELVESRRTVALRKGWKFEERVTMCGKGALGEDYAIIDIFSIDKSSEEILYSERFNIHKSALL